MKILVYYNVLHKNFNVLFDNYFFNEDIGSTYKINSILISKIYIEEKSSPLKVSLKKLKSYKNDFGDFLIKLGERIKGKKSNNNVVIYKDRFPWWKL